MNTLGKIILGAVTFGLMAATGCVTYFPKENETHKEFREVIRYLKEARECAIYEHKKWYDKHMKK